MLGPRARLAWRGARRYAAGAPPAGNLSGGGGDALPLDVRFEWRTLALVAAVTVAAGTLVGLAAALRFARAPLHVASRTDRIAKAGWRRRLAVGRPLMAVQIASSLLVLVDGARVVAPGIATGLIAALAASRVLRAQLFALSPTDPATVAAALALILVVSAAATAIPAHRAARVDPKMALRAE